MTTSTTINGSWYIVELRQQEKKRNAQDQTEVQDQPCVQDNPNAALVLAWGRGLFRDNDLKFVPEAKKSLEELAEIAALGPVENESHIYEDPVNYWEQLAARRLMRKDEETFAGVGNLGIYKRQYTQERWITPAVAEELLKADVQKPHYLSATLYVVRYRDASDRDTNPFHQTAIIARDKEDLRQFIWKEFPNWIDNGYRPLEELVDDHSLRLLSGIVVMPEVLAGFQQKKREAEERKYRRNSYDEGLF